MPTTVRTYWGLQPQMSTLYYPWAAIAADSTVIITASEYDSQNNVRFIGSASVKVSDILPMVQGVSFAISHDWNSPLNIVTDITVLDNKPVDVQFWSPPDVTPGNWTAQRNLSDRASTHGPSLVVMNGNYGPYGTPVGPTGIGPANDTAVYMAWKGSQGDSSLWWAQSADGINWGPQQHLPDDFQSSEGPCLATWYPNSSAPALMMAWKNATDSDIYCSTNNTLATNGWNAKALIPDVGTSARPALIYFGGYMILAWKGIQGDSGIWWSKMFVAAGGKLSWSPKQLIPDRGTSDGPVLAVLNGQLHMFWKDPTDASVWHAALADPTGTWGPQQQITEIDGSSTSFAVATRVNELILLWKGKPGDNAIWFCTFDGTTFSPQMSIPYVGTESYPAITSMNTRLIACWRGIGNDRSLWTSSVQEQNFAVTLGSTSVSNVLQMPAGGPSGDGSSTQQNASSAETQLQALQNINIDFSVSRADLLDWLNNPQYTPYPAIAGALINLIGQHKLLKPVYIDVIVDNYTNAAGATSPRKVSDVDPARLTAAVIASYKSRYGQTINNLSDILQ